MPNVPYDDSMLTPFGLPSSQAFTIPVPDDAVGLIIGKNGETIRRLQTESGARIQVARMKIKDSNLRNVFVEGDREKYMLAKDAIMEVINQHPRHNEMIIFIGEHSPFGIPNKEMYVPERYVGLIIGKSSETLKKIASSTNTKIFIQQTQKNAGMGLSQSTKRRVEIVGDENDCAEAETKINELIDQRQAGKDRNPSEFSTPSNYQK